MDFSNDQLIANQAAWVLKILKVSLNAPTYLINQIQQMPLPIQWYVISGIYKIAADMAPTALEESVNSFLEEKSKRYANYGNNLISPAKTGDQLLEILEPYRDALGRIAIEYIKFVEECANDRKRTYQN